VVLLPMKVGDPLPAEVSAGPQRIAVGDEAATGMRRWLDGFIAEHVRPGPTQ